MVVFGAWAMTWIALLALFNSLDYEYLFAIDLLGLLIIVQLMSPYVMKPLWRSRLDLSMAVGMAIFGFLVFKKALYFAGLALV